MKGEGQVALVAEWRDACRSFVGKPEKKRPPAIPSLRWDDNIKIGLQEIGLGEGAWTGLI